MEQEMQEQFDAKSVNDAKARKLMLLRVLSVILVLIVTVPMIIVYHPFSHSSTTNGSSNTEKLFTTSEITSYCDRVEVRQLPTELLPNLQEGNVNFPVTSRDEKARKYFNQGMTLFYSFNGEDAVRFFRKALQLDPSMMMAHYGMALAVGSNVNVNVDEKCRLYAHSQIEYVRDNKQNMSPMEIDLIDAHYERYSIAATSSSATTPAMAVGAPLKYRDAMAAVYEKYKDKSPDVAAIYVDSIMDLFPFEFWRPNGEPTDAKHCQIMLDVLDYSLKLFPTHIGLNHYNIHAREGSAYPKDALASADLFYNMTLNAGHIIHMPAHIYYRLGDYQKSVEANLRAIGMDKANTDLCASDIFDYDCDPIYAGYYNTHDLLFLTLGYTMLGQSEKAVETSKMIDRAVPRYMSSGQPRLGRYMSASILTLERFHRWDAIIKIVRPEEGLMLSPINIALYHYAKAKAFIGLEDYQKAKEQRQMFNSAMEEVTPHVSALWGVVNGINVTRLASLDLEANFAHFVDGETEKAINHLRLAVQHQDGFPYDEPVCWLPMRVKLGAILYIAGDYERALLVFDEDLVGTVETRGEETGKGKGNRWLRNGTTVATLEDPSKSDAPTIPPVVVNVAKERIDQRTTPNNVWSAFGRWQCLVELKRPNQKEAEEYFRMLWEKSDYILEQHPKMKDLL